MPTSKTSHTSRMTASLRLGSSPRVMTQPPDGQPSLTAAERDHLTQAQAYEDAIAYRRARLTRRCPHCGTGRCDDHATDADLITSYQQGRRRALGMTG